MYRTTLRTAGALLLLVSVAACSQSSSKRPAPVPAFNFAAVLSSTLAGPPPGQVNGAATSVTPGQISTEVPNKIEILGSGFTDPAYVELTSGHLVIQLDAQRVTSTSLEVYVPALGPATTTFGLRVGTGNAMPLMSPSVPLSLAGPTLPLSVVPLPVTSGQNELLYPRYDHETLTLPSGDVLVVGGVEADRGAISVIELYRRFPTSVFTQVGYMAAPRVDHQLVLLDNGEVLVAGGRTVARGAARGWGQPAAGLPLEVFDFAANATRTLDLPVADASGFAMVPIGAGRVLMAGGVDANGSAITAAYVIDTLSGAVTPVPGPITPRRDAAAVRLPSSGHVALFGGVDTIHGVNPLDTAETFDPATNTWAPLPGTMTTPRVGAKAILDPTSSGTSVLLVGGNWPGRTYAERWNGPGFAGFAVEVATAPFTTPPAPMFGAYTPPTPRAGMFGSGTLFAASGAEEWQRSYWGATGAYPLIDSRDDGGHTVSRLDPRLAVVIGGHRGGVPVATPESLVDRFGGPLSARSPSAGSRRTPWANDVTLFSATVTSPAGRVVYVLDRSVSMSWDDQPYTDLNGQPARGPRMVRAATELARSIQWLDASMEFNIISYDCATTSWRSTLQPATSGNKLSAVGWLLALTADGATGTGPAVAQALADPTVDTVLLVSDGTPNCGANGISGHRAMINAANTQGAEVHSFGIAASGSYRAFLQSVASDSAASYFDVP